MYMRVSQPARHVERIARNVDYSRVVDRHDGQYRGRRGELDDASDGVAAQQSRVRQKAEQRQLKSMSAHADMFG
jgi:pyrrolidone-carboxylate peptidase